MCHLCHHYVHVYVPLLHPVQMHVSDEALDRALRPFYLLPSPQQEKDKVLYLIYNTKLQMVADFRLFLLAGCCVRSRGVC